MPGTKSFTTGAYSVGGGLAGVRSNTRAFPEVSALLRRYISSLQHDFCFMAAAVFVNLRATPHRDLGNLSGSFSLVSGVGPFSGGEVWVSSDSGSVPCPFRGFLSWENSYQRRTPSRCLIHGTCTAQLHGLETGSWLWASLLTSELPWIP